MNRPASRVAIVGMLVCTGLGLLALALAQWATRSPVLLPPPFVDTQPAQWPRLVLPAALLADSPAITIAPEPYRHPSGAFQIRYPADWQVDESEDSVQFTGPEAIGQFSVVFVGREAVSASDYEQDLRQTWGDLANFSVDSISQAGLPGRWEAIFSFEQPALPDQVAGRMLGFTRYWPQSKVLYIFTALMPATFREVLQPTLQSIANSLQTDPNPALADSE